jgi:hypothetical protein
VIPDQRTLDRLAKVCGMFGSDQMGERAAAALRADSIRQQSGLSWAELFAGVVSPRPSAPMFDPADASPPALLAKCAPVLTAWEREFLASIGSQRTRTTKQNARLAQIREKCVTWWTNGGQA